MAAIDAYGIAQYVTGGVAGLFATVFVVQKFLNSWKSGAAESSVITLMHQELERMSLQNTSLSSELGKLQRDIIELNKELRILSSENQRLYLEIAALTGEVTRLQTILQKGVQGDRTG
jgi:FtsZ-binding cell division protein ZapB